MEAFNFKKIFFLGIGGIGVSALARMMRHQGSMILGSDMQDSELLETLRSEGCIIHRGQNIDDIPGDVDAIVYSEAVADYHPEFVDTIRTTFSVPVLSYPEMLGYVSKNLKTIAVCGTHGKTTTTGMIATMMIDAQQSPQVIVGSILAREQSNFVPGTSNYFVVEACEYKRSFLQLSPSLLVITNIDEDHMDYYHDLADIQSAFRELAQKVPRDGYIIARTDDPVVQAVLVDVVATIIPVQDFYDAQIQLQVPSIYNLENAASARAVGHALSLDKSIVQKSLEQFQGTWRRFEYRGTTRFGGKIYDDYAHHPTEIKALFAGAKKIFPQHEIIAIFEPHLFSRTKALFQEFVECFDDADKVFLLPIYYAREHDDGSLSSRDIYQALTERRPQVTLCASYDEACDTLSMIDTTDTVIFTVGAGPITRLSHMLVKALGR